VSTKKEGALTVRAKTGGGEFSQTTGGWDGEGGSERRSHRGGVKKKKKKKRKKKKKKKKKKKRKKKKKKKNSQKGTRNHEGKEIKSNQWAFSRVRGTRGNIKKGKEQHGKRQKKRTNLHKILVTTLLRGSKKHTNGEMKESAKVWQHGRGGRWVGAPAGKIGEGL